jgi:hypothetical protein
MHTPHDILILSCFSPQRLVPRPIGFFLGGDVMVTVDDKPQSWLHFDERRCDGQIMVSYIALTIHDLLFFPLDTKSMVS